ncbi:MAG: DUF4845 domain-containing protein [Candidatus Thiodiazotropha sp.]|jgi:hypothetical protein
MQHIKKQRGLTFISWLIIFVMAGTLIMVGIRIAPVYMDHMAVKTSLLAVKNESLAARKSVRELRSLLMKKLDVNSITQVTKDNITIKRSNNVTTINVAYEVRRHLAYNLDLAMTFNETVELTAN